MAAIRIRKTIDSETLHLPELKPLMGRTVEITIAAAPDPAARQEFDRLVADVPQSETAWEARLETLRGWRADVRFEAYWPVIDQMLTVDFGSFQRRAAARPGGLEGYDFDAWSEQRKFDQEHAHDHIP
jgi:hypothetical protein